MIIYKNVPGESRMDSLEKDLVEANDLDSAVTMFKDKHRAKYLNIDNWDRYRTEHDAIDDYGFSAHYEAIEFIYK